MNKITSIKTKADYEAALKRIDTLIVFQPKEGTAVYKELDDLGNLVYAYEEIHFPITAPLLKR